MASRGKTYMATVGRWKVLGSNLQPQLETLPQLTARHAELVRMTGEAETLELRQAQLQADLQEVNRQRRELVKSGEELRNRIGAVLRAEHGFTSERLLEFGLKPKRVRKKAGEKPASTPPPTAEPTAKQ